VAATFWVLGFENFILRSCGCITWGCGGGVTIFQPGSTARSPKTKNKKTKTKQKTRGTGKDKTPTEVGGHFFEVFCGVLDLEKYLFGVFELPMQRNVQKTQ
jgi:hypothetical protein